MNTDKAWERFGRTEPYFGVISDDKFRNANQPGSERSEFFRSGEQHISELYNFIRQRDPAFSPDRSLDFGCGVGRLLLTLSSISREVVGVDVSTSMLEEARRNLDKANCLNVELVTSVAEARGEFDLVHSFIVFQHIPPARGMKLLTHLLSKLRPGGWGALHFVYGYAQPTWWQLAYRIRWHVPFAHALANVIQRQPVRRPFMQMNAYPMPRVLEAIRAHGASEVTAQLTNHGGFLGAFLIFKRGS